MKRYKLILAVLVAGQVRAAGQLFRPGQHPHPHGRGEHYRPAPPGIGDRIRDNSAIWQLLKTLQGTYKAMFVSRIGHQRIKFEELRMVREPQQQDYGFMTPRLEAYFRQVMQKFDGVMKSVAAEKGALYVDLASRTEWTDADFYDLVHMTPQGADKVGAFLYEALKTEVAAARRR
jgi:hypothetical protein